jgi:anti-anti-sigma regulatory factor
VPLLKIQRTTDRTAIVLTVSGRLDAENVSELCESLDAIPRAAAVVLDLTDLVLADRDVVRLLREFEASGRIVLRNCPPYIRIWMAAEDIY